jgi:hypothetical protein
MVSQNVMCITDCVDILIVPQVSPLSLGTHFPGFLEFRWVHVGTFSTMGYEWI